ncbi:hypothetical protein HPB49_003876 [Dermacentor silvarum]|uniref:Uncharacterized protein n=1 Tax=Dermacentor silvarum TaxID=543639 RepID=A0ACB8C1G5_DERSI|nr:hypothetical protein HPB49_003876 [Dermacentor silvarum]
MPPRTLDILLGLVRESITVQDSRFRSAISAAERLAMTVRFLATGQTLRDVSFNFLVGRSTAYCVVSTVILQPKLQRVKQLQFVVQAAAEFEEVWNMPHCVGAIDGKHVNIECLPNSGSSDRNYKGTFSKCLFAVCDAHYRREFLHIEMGNRGSESDGGIFSRSKLKSNILAGHLHLPPVRPVGSKGPLPYYFVGDEETQKPCAKPGKHYSMMQDRSLWHIKSVIQQVTVMEYQKKAVCEHHFLESDFIDSASYTDSMTGKEIEVPLKLRRLKPAAIPSVFPNCPAYLSRQETSACESPEEKRSRLDTEALQEAILSSVHSHEAEEKNVIASFKDLLTTLSRLCY